MTRVREEFAAVRSLGLTVVPFPLRVLFTWMLQAFPFITGAVSSLPQWPITSLAAMLGAAAQEMHETGERLPGFAA